MNKLHIAQVGYTAISIVFYIAAVLFIFSPWLPPAMLSIFSGVCLPIYGVIKIVGYFSEDLYCLAFRYDFAFGLLLLVVGAIVLVKFQEAETWLPPGIGWIALLDSVMKVQMAQEAKRFGLRQWNVLLAAAIITGVLGVLRILQSIAPAGDTNILTALVLLSAGVMNHCTIRFAVYGPLNHSDQEQKQNKSQQKEF